MRRSRPLLGSVLSFAILALLLVSSGFGFSPANQTGVAGGFAAPVAQDTAVRDGASSIQLSIAPDSPDAGLQAVIESQLEGVPGDWAVVVKKLDTGQFAAINADEVTVSASLYKVFVLYELLRQVKAGERSLDDMAEITASAAAFDTSIDSLYYEVGSQVRLSSLATRMITWSDNTAAITLARLVGVDNVNATIRNLGLENTKLDFSGGDNLTTAREMNRIFEIIESGKAVSRVSSSYMLDLLLEQQLNDLIPVGLPDGTYMAHKTGTLEQLMHDSGIVYGASGPYIITLLSWNLDDYPTAYATMPKISRAVYDYFNGRPYSPSAYFAETKQIVGPSFLLYYNTHGGEEAFGQPIGPETEQFGTTYQYFERARFERPTGSDGPIILGRIGAELVKHKGLTFSPATPPEDPEDPNTLWFEATQQAIGQPFLDYWRDHGASDVLGLPLSGVQEESVGGDGPYRVQYFERARLELHGDTVVLGDVGSETLTLASAP